MAENLFIPKLGMTMEKATIAEWKFEEGDNVAEGDVVLVIDTEKVAHEIESPRSGLLIIMADVGEELPCGAVIGMIAESQEEHEALKKDRPKSAFVDKDQLENKNNADEGGEKVSDKAKPTGKVFISPVAKKMAQKNSIDLSTITGSGPSGRITKADIEKAIASGAPAAAFKSEPARSQPAESKVESVIDGKRVKSVIPLKGMRKAIADHMRHSLDTAARVTAFMEIDMTQMIKIRKRYVEKSDIIGIRITYTDLIIFIVAKALKNVPIINASLIGDEIKIWEDINVGFAASVISSSGQTGLVVPVIRNADKMSLGDIGRARKNLTDKARNNQLSVDDMVGGTFTITNTGTFTPEWHVQTPIINQPQSAILGISSIVEKPVVENGEIVIRPMMPISFAFDHRVMDGAPPAQFLMKVAEMMKDPDMMIL